jgi:hypothetical protein
LRQIAELLNISKNYIDMYISDIMVLICGRLPSEKMSAGSCASGLESARAFWSS